MGSEEQQVIARALWEPYKAGHLQIDVVYNKDALKVPPIDMLDKKKIGGYIKQYDSAVKTIYQQLKCEWNLYLTIEYN